MARELFESQPQARPAHEEIARRAYEIFLEQGCPDGHDLDHWLQAEAQLSSSAQAQQQPGSRSQKSGTRQPQRKAA